MEFSIKLSIYFEVKDSLVYGGSESIGYAGKGINFTGIDYGEANVFNNEELMKQYIEKEREWMAGFCEVPKDNVRVISEQEYEANTEGDDED